MKVGVLALQGDVAEHAAMIRQAGASPVIVKRAEQLRDVDGLIIPGGESTAIGKMLRRFDMLAPLQEQIASGFPVYGTCAGMILLADRIQGSGKDQPAIGGMDITVRRNAFGRQRESFETDLDIPVVGIEPLHAVFIRSPLIEEAGASVNVLAEVEGRPVAARQNNLLVSSFHPELTHDLRMHQYFLGMIEQRRDS